MSLIDNTYFINDINLPGDVLTNNSNFNNIIARYEPEVLTDLLGYELYKALLADLDGNGNPVTQRFIDLIDGAEFSFEFCGYTINTKWNGLRNSDKTSLISYYTYFEYREDNDTFYASGAQVEALTENSTNIGQIAKLTDIYNKMVELYGQSRYNNSTWYDPDTFEHLTDEPSAYNFLLANKADYPEWVFKSKSKINQFGI
jgi:hypothetical protein